MKHSVCVYFCVSYPPVLGVLYSQPNSRSKKEGINILQDTENKKDETKKNTQSRELYKLIGYCNNECNTTSLTLAMEMRDHHAHEAKQRGNLSRSPQGLWNNLTTQNQKKME